MNTSNNRLLAILAHPDDEALGFGGTLAKYAAQGVEIYLITATRGEHGWFGSPDDYPGERQLGKIRETELHNAAAALGIKEPIVLDYIDGQLDQAEHTEIIASLANHIRRIQPDVVITFDPFGVYGHPDHIAISQFTLAAIVQAARPSPDNALPGHEVQKLYYRVETQEALALYEAVFGELIMTVDEVERRTIGWADWTITTHIKTGDHWQTIWQAIQCHQTQLPTINTIRDAIGEKPLWDTESYYRVFSLVNGGRDREDDLFVGVKPLLRDSI